MHFLTKLLVLAGLSLGCAVPAFAIPTLTISSSGNGVFVLQGSGFQSVGGAKITVRYDTATLTNPRINKGGLASGNAILVPNTNTPGIIIMGLIDQSGLSGSGVIATINFDLPGSSPGVIQLLSADVININSDKISSQVQIINPAGTALMPENLAGLSGGSSPSTAPEATSATAPQVSSQPVAVGVSPAPVPTAGSPVVPSGEPEVIRTQLPTEVAQEPATPVDSTPATATVASVETTLQATEGPLAEKKALSHVVYQSVLEQFRTFAGQRTPQAFTGIFTRHTMPGIRQEPVVGLTDGTSKLRLSIILKSPGKNAPMYSLKNVKLVSLKIESDGSWTIELLPAKGINSATLTMLQNDAETEIPLLVAPPLPDGTGLGSDGKLTEADFVRFLAERDTDKAPRFDLNEDGKRDYIDDYIFTANYLFKKGM